MDIKMKIRHGYLISHVAKATGFTYRQLHYGAQQGWIPAPQRVIGKRRYYSEAEYKELVAALLKYKEEQEI